MKQRAAEHPHLAMAQPEAPPASWSEAAGRGEPGQQAPRSPVPGGASPLVRGARVLIAFGVLVALFIGYEFPLSALYEDRSQRSLLAAFKQQVPTETLDSPSALLSEGSPVALLHIGRLHLDQMVVEGSSPSDLKLGPGHLRVSPLPGEFGNSVILGRRTTYGAPFSGLQRLRRGDRIVVTTGQGSFTYVVSAQGWAGAQDAGPMLATRDNLLTLITSDPALGATRRYYLRARLQGDPLAVASRPPAVVASGDLGLAGEDGSLFLAVVSCQLLLGAAWLAWRLRRRWPAPVGYMLAIPVLLALAVLTFSSFDGILPGAL